MKKIFAIILVFLFALAGCSGKTEAPSEDISQSVSQESTAEGEESITYPEEQMDPEDVYIKQIEEKAKKLGLTYDEYMSLDESIWQLVYDGSIFSSWPGDVNSPYEYGSMNIEEVKREGSNLEVKVTLSAPIYLNIDKMEETTQYYNPIYKYEGNAINNLIPVGEAHLKGEMGETVVFTENEYTPYENPGISFLKAETEKLKDVLAKSPKAVEKYPDTDKYMQRAILAQVLKTRYAESFDDVTLYDLENMRELELSYPMILPELSDECLPNDYKFSSEIIREMKKLKSFSTYFVLDDYSVFEGMELDSLFINLQSNDGNPVDFDLGTLDAEYIGYLTLEGFYQDIALDLKGMNIDTLELRSWTNAVTEFKGCENIRSLSIYGTTTDMTLINKDNFPKAEYIYFDIYSDTARKRDFSNLKTFGEDTYISIKLSYQAANNATVETLEGVRLGYLEVIPDDGPYPIAEPDEALFDKIDIDRDNIYWGSASGAVG